MARLPYLDAKDLGPQYQDLFVGSPRLNGRIMNVRRMMAHAPRVAQLRFALGNALYEQPGLDPHLSELALLTVGRVTRCTYEFHHHVQRAKLAGVPEAQIEALPVWERHPAFSERERAVIRYAEQITRDVQVTDEAFGAVRSFLDDEQLVALTLLIAHYNAGARFLEAFQVDVEVDEDADTPAV
jgi:alkylhydroperoxidase family enzyme